MTTLPIMLFNERALTPSFGYVFDPQWLDPHESIVSILWEFVRMNRLSGHLVIMQLARDSRFDPYVGIAACQSDVDIRRLHQALGLPLKIVRGSLVPDSLSRFCETDSQVGFDPEPPRKTRKRRIGRCMMLACVVDSRNSDLEPFPPLDDERRPRAALLHSQSLPTPLATKIKKRAENLRRVFI